ncbi:hypothetical protein COO60DRAFT_1646869 [Scenedesmus sp. NREL 46B-D3]|nr:hypothetical protein COO60DRAFT_1646869 [Scenedesmus sp. NREL 46B-D3]
MDVQVGGSVVTMCERGHAAIAGKSLRISDTGYALINATNKAVHLHVVQAVLGLEPPKGHVIHHVNGNRLDNRLDNLAVAPHALNSQAKLKAHGCSSAYRGVTRKQSSAGSWSAQIRAERHQVHIGTFRSEAEAGRAYDKAALAIHGPNAGTNGLLTPAEMAHVLEHVEAFRPAPPPPTARGLRSLERLQAAIADPEGQLGPMPDPPHLVLHGKVAAGRVAQVSAQGWRKAAMYRWYVASYGSKEYVYGFVLAAGEGGMAKTLAKLHRFLMGCEPLDGRIIDHADGDTLNNTDANLRDSSPSANARNKASKPGSSSAHVGVDWVKRASKWRAQIRIQGKARHLGLFACQEEAAQAYQRALGSLRQVLTGKAAKTTGGLRAADLKRNKAGTLVSKAASQKAKARYKNSSASKFHQLVMKHFNKARADGLAAAMKRASAEWQKHK